MSEKNILSPFVGKWYWILVVLACFGVGVFGCRDEGTPRRFFGMKKVPTARDTAILKAASIYDSLFTMALQLDTCPGGALVVIQDSTIIIQKGYGLREKGKNDTINTHTLFRIASLSKGMTAVLVARLVEAGQLHWNDRVVDVLPNFELHTRAVTDSIRLWHLLSHTTGLPHQAYSNLVEQGMERDSIIMRLSRIPLPDALGTQYNYQNAAFAVIEQIVERVTNKPFNRVFEEQLLRPLKTHETSNSYLAMMATYNKAMPHQYWNENDTWNPQPITEKYYNTTSAGGVNASIRDMGIWLRFLLEKQSPVLSDSLKKTLWTPRISTTEEGGYFNRWPEAGETGYGLGWRLMQWEGRPLVFHGGYVNSYRSEIVLDIQRGWGMVALFNAPCMCTGDITPLFLRQQLKIPE